MRLQTAGNHAGVQQEVLAAARAAIIDSDVAADAAELTGTSILEQSVTAVLAQATRQPEVVLKLLNF
ncbi:MAG: hypothetical protein KDD60_06850 [Bdellovibrionales bacterium]|nr:hypothetical protein [Bdellovibrionales bacterium]